MDDKRIGLDGAYKPRLSLHGRPINGAIVTRHYLGEGYYVAIDPDKKADMDLIEDILYGELFRPDIENVPEERGTGEDVPTPDATGSDELQAGSE